MKSNKGFTLVELIVVIAILALLSTLAINAFSGIMEQATRAQERQAAAVVASSLNTFNSIARNDTFTIGAAEGVAAPALSVPGVPPITVGIILESGATTPPARAFGPNTRLQHTDDTGLLPIGVNWNMDERVWLNITGAANPVRLNFNATTRLWEVIG